MFVSRSEGPPLNQTVLLKKMEWPNFSGLNRQVVVLSYHQSKDLSEYKISNQNLLRVQLYLKVHQEEYEG